MIVRTIGQYDIVGVIGGYMVYPTGPTIPGSARPSQLYTNYSDAKELAEWLADRDAGLPGETAMSLQRYLALYQMPLDIEIVLPFEERHDIEGKYKRISEPLRVTFRPRIPPTALVEVQALDAEGRADFERFEKQRLEFEKRRVERQRKRVAAYSRLASPTPSEAAGNVRAADTAHVMAPAPEVDPVAGGPSIDPNWCPTCIPAGLGYCQCEITSNE